MSADVTHESKFSAIPNGHDGIAQMKLFSSGSNISVQSGGMSVIDPNNGTHCNVANEQNSQ